jgi:hypothetical protein
MATLQSITRELDATRNAMIREMAKAIPAHICPDAEGVIVECLNTKYPRNIYEPLLDEIIEKHRSRHARSEMIAFGFWLCFVMPTGYAAICVASLANCGGGII